MPYIITFNIIIFHIIIFNFNIIIFIFIIIIIVIIIFVITMYFDFISLGSCPLLKCVCRAIYASVSLMHVYAKGVALAVLAFAYAKLVIVLIVNARSQSH
jgi:hypothetical protein